MTGVTEPGTALVVVEELSLRANRSDRYRPAASILGRRRAGPVAPVGVDEDDELDDEEDAAGDEEEPDARGALDRVSFRVEAGEACAVLGDAGSGAGDLIRVLGRTAFASAGRAVLRGRVAPTIEFGVRFCRPDSSMESNARTLAQLARIPRGERRTYVSELVAFALTDARGRRVSLAPKVEVRRLALAAALDPAADVLLLDGLPVFGDAAFLDRCLDRIETSLARGAAVVFATHELDLAELVCDHGILLERGRVVESGEIAVTVAALRRRRMAAAAEQHAHDVRGFDARAAILAVDAGGLSGGGSLTQDESVDLRITFELAVAPARVRVAIVLAAGSQSVRVAQPEEELFDRPGLYAVDASIPVGLLDEGEWSADVRATVNAAGEASTLGRRVSTPVLVEEPEALRQLDEKEVVGEVEDDSEGSADLWADVRWSVTSLEN